MNAFEIFVAMIGGTFVYTLLRVVMGDKPTPLFVGLAAVVSAMIAYLLRLAS